MQPPEAFLAQLGLVLKALEPSVVAPKGEGRPTAPLIFQSELWQFLHKTRESAELSYAREFDLVELDRRILFLLRTKGPLVPAELSSSVGVDKAQVSRSVKRLLELKMVDREQIRSPVTLTRKGEHHADRMLRLADLRNRELTFDIDDDELAAFFAAIELLLDRAVALYEQERARIAAQERGQAELGSIGRPERRSNEPVLIDRARILSPLLTLSAYLRPQRRADVQAPHRPVAIRGVGAERDRHGSTDRLADAHWAVAARPEPGRPHRARADRARPGHARRPAGPPPRPLLARP